MPVLPDVASTMVDPGLSRPCFSASSIMATPMRSLIDPSGLRDSSLATSREGGATICRSVTSGVLPTVAVTDSWIMSRPERVALSYRVVLEKDLGVTHVHQHAITLLQPERVGFGARELHRHLLRGVQPHLD